MVGLVVGVIYITTRGKNNLVQKYSGSLDYLLYDLRRFEAFTTPIVLRNKHSKQKFCYTCYS